MYVNQVTSFLIVHTLKYLIDVSKPKSSRSWTKLKLAFGVLNFKEVKKYTNQNHLRAILTFQNHSSQPTVVINVSLFLN